MTVEHDHPDPSSPTPGCEACIQAVKADQQQAEIDSWPRRVLDIGVFYTVENEGSIEVEIPVEPGTEITAEEAYDRWRRTGLMRDAVSDQLGYVLDWSVAGDGKGGPDVRWGCWANDLRPGQVPGQLDIFGAAS